MRRKRRTFTSEFKLKVILDSLKERESLSELSQKYDLHQEEDVEKLYSKIGKLQMEIDFLKKKLV